MISLDPPLHQGQQQYTHLVLRADNQKELDVHANLPADLAEKWPRLQSDMRSTMFGHISTLLCTVTARNLTTTGSFRTAAGARFIKCANRSNDGCLYLLEAAFMFVPRPPMFIRYDDINYVELDRVSTMERTFDVTVVMRSSTAKHHFTSLPRSDFDAFNSFMHKKKIHVQRSAAGDEERGGRIDQDDDDENDMSSDDEDYAESVARRKAAAGSSDEDDDDDDDDDDDGDDEDAVVSESELADISGQPAAKRAKGEDGKAKKASGSKEKKDKEKDKEKKHKHHHHHHHKHKHDKDKKDKKGKDDKK